MTERPPIDLGRQAAGLPGLDVQPVEIHPAEHEEERRQRHWKERVAILGIASITTLAAAIVVMGLLRPVPEKRTDWAVSVLQAVLGGAVGYALK